MELGSAAGAADDDATGALYVPTSKLHARAAAIAAARGDDLGPAAPAPVFAQRARFGSATEPRSPRSPRQAHGSAGGTAYDMRPYAERVAALERAVAEMPLMHMPQRHADDGAADAGWAAAAARADPSADAPPPALFQIEAPSQLRLQVIVRSLDSTAPALASGTSSPSLAARRAIAAASAAKRAEWQAAPPAAADAPPAPPPQRALGADAAPSPATATASASTAAADAPSSAAAAKTAVAAVHEPAAALQPPRLVTAVSSPGGRPARASGKRSGRSSGSARGAAELDDEGAPLPARSRSEPAHGASAAQLGLDGGGLDEPAPFAPASAAEPASDLAPGEVVLVSTELLAGSALPSLDATNRVVEPCGHAALRPRDEIVEVAGRPLGESALQEAAALLRAQAGAAVPVLARRASTLAPFVPPPPAAAAAAGLASGSVRACLVTWNMHGKEPPERVPQLLQHAHSWAGAEEEEEGGGAPPPPQYDLYVVGSQEAERSIERSMLLPSKAKWEASLGGTLGDGYVLLASHTLAAMHIAVYATHELARQVSGVRTAHVATGYANALGNKGAVGVSLLLGRTSCAFVSCHLSAGQRAVEARNADLARIDAHLELWPPGASRARAGRAARASLSARFERVFWLGDLNYRVNGNRSIVDKLLAPPSAREMAAAEWAGARAHAAQNLRVLQRNDQLRLQLVAGRVLRACVEGEIRFRPTYKFDSRDPSVYDRSEKARIPAWTDRILFAPPAGAAGAVRLHYYNAVEAVRSSDHRPVLADLSIDFAPRDALLPPERAPPARALSRAASAAAGGARARDSAAATGGAGAGGEPPGPSAARAAASDVGPSASAGREASGVCVLS